MERRDFLRVAALAGLAFVTPTRARRAGADDPAGGPLFVGLHAAGGWDPIFLTDPKLDPAMTRVYTEVGEAGAIRYAKIGYDPAALQIDTAYRETYRDWLMTNEAFFGKHQARLLVLNGLDTTTNSHDGGTRATWTGRTSGEYPALPALFASSRADRPMAFLSGGGFDATADIVPLTRIGGLDVFQRVAWPNQIDPSRSDTRFFSTPSVWSRIQATQRDRLGALATNERLPRARRAAGALLAARSSNLGLDRLVLPSDLASIPGGQLDDLEGVMRQIQVVCAAFKAGLAVSATLGLGGFDTHSNHDRNQVLQLMKLLRAVDYLYEEAGRQGVMDRLTIVVGSDFGRGPRYNGTGGGSGKDHWPITTMMFLGAGVRGGRVIGATDADVKPVLVDPSTLAPSARGVRLRPEHVHRALRRQLGLDALAASARFPLAAEDAPIFA